MTIFVGNQAQDFSAKAVDENNAIIDFNFKSFIANQNCILLFYPLDFTFVCPSELIALNNRYEEFTKRKTKVVAVSVDSQFSHLKWKSLEPSQGGVGNLRYPLVSDLKKEIGNMYNILNRDGVAVRGTFFIDKDFIVRNITINDLPIGRNIDELLRIIDAFEYHLKHGEVCPAGWSAGKPGMKPTSAGMTEYLKNNSTKL